MDNGMDHNMDTTEEAQDTLISNNEQSTDNCQPVFSSVNQTSTDVTLSIETMSDDPDSSTSTMITPFQYPTDSVIRNAIGEPVPPLLEPERCFLPLPIPGPSDWLSQYKEKGQTFQDFVQSNWNTSTNYSNDNDIKRNKVYMLPIGSSGVDRLLDLRVLSEYMSVFLQMPNLIENMPAIQVRKGYLPAPTTNMETKGCCNLSSTERETGDINERNRKRESKEALRLRSLQTAKVQIDSESDFDASIYHGPFPLLSDHGESFEDVQFQTLRRYSIQKESLDLSNDVRSNESWYEKDDPVNKLEFQPQKDNEQSNTNCCVYFEIAENDVRPVACRKAIDHDLSQLYISDVLAVIESMIPRDAVCVIGITMWDLYMDDADLFVVGWAGTRCGLFSFSRYDPLFVKLNDRKTRSRMEVCTPLPKVGSCEYQSCRISTILRRSLKTVTHEVLHIFGLKHCIYFACLMNGTASLYEDDQAPMFLCPVCLRKLHFILQFPIIKRYNDMLQFFKERDDFLAFSSEVLWLTNRINVLSLSDFQESEYLSEYCLPRISSIQNGRSRSTLCTTKERVPSLNERLSKRSII